MPLTVAANTSSNPPVQASGQFNITNAKINLIVQPSSVWGSTTNYTNLVANSTG